MKWIRNKRKSLPDDRVDVLAYSKLYGTIIADFCETVNSWFATINGRETKISDITHWMPLPEKPKGTKTEICEYCRKISHNMPLIDTDPSQTPYEYLAIEKRNWLSMHTRIVEASTKINFCPICGRKLEGKK